MLIQVVGIEDIFDSDFCSVLARAIELAADQVFAASTQQLVEHVG